MSLLQKCIITIIALIATSTVVAENAKPIAIIHTSKGAITVELNPELAPVTVANFLDYAKSGFYRRTIFHRVIKNFMIQGGGFTKNFKEKYTAPAIINESGNGLHNDRWSIAMARTSDPDSATSQFYINTKMNPRLDAAAGEPGYAVFGMVIDGKDVVKAIESSATMSFNGHNNVPVDPVYIEKVEVK